MISICLFLLLDFLWTQKHNTIIIQNKFLFYFLQWTWGILMNLIGGIVTLCLMLKVKPQKYGRCIYMQLPVNWGLSLGMFIFGHSWCAEHEHGHAFQNAIYGPFFVTVVALPSVIRYWIREIQYKCKKPPKTDYDAIWFEGQATKSGLKYFERA